MINIRKNKLYSILSKNYLAKAFSLFSLVQIISALTSFGILILYTKYLPAEEFGKISIIWMFIMIASILIDGGLNSSFSIRFYKVSKKEKTKNIYSIFIYNLIIFVVFFLFFLIFPGLLQNILQIELLRSGIIIIFLLILFMIFGNFYTNILVVDKKPRHYFIVKLIFNTILIVSSVVYLIVLKEGYISYLKAYLISYFVLMIGGLYFFISNYRPRIKLFISLNNLKSLLRLGLLLVPNTLMLMLLTWGDRYILNLYAGLAVVGIYTIGYRFAEVINSFIINPFGQAMAPLLFQQYSKSKDEYKKKLGRVFKYYWLIMFSIMIGYFTILREVFQLFIGIEYIKGYDIVGIVLVGVILWGITNLLGATVVMKEKTNMMFLFTFVSVALNIALNFVLIPTYGMYVAAAATMISFILYFIIISIYTQKLVFINYDYKFIIKSVSISVVFFILILFLSYLEINIFLRFGLKVSLFLIFILLSYKFLELGKSIKGFINYGTKSK
ncbi:MAG: oligosaccharide flippase family protein [Actinomycetia bacterium]|nr:oligosaccharide flippase family protein [Actinomycetes bacterium]